MHGNWHLVAHVAHERQAALRAEAARAHASAAVAGPSVWVRATRALARRG